MLKAQLTILLKRTADRTLKVRRNIGIQSHRRHGNAIQNRVENHARSFTVKWRRTRRHFVQHHAKTKDVAARIHLFAAHLLGRHIRHGAERAAGARQILGRQPRRLLRGRNRLR